MKILLLFCLKLVLVQSAFAQNQPVSQSQALPNVTSGTKIGSLDGGKKVSILRQSKSMEAKSGQELNVGDRVVTLKGSTASLVLPDGSIVVLAQDSEIEITEVASSPASSRFHKGQMRGIFRTLQKKIDSKNSKPFKYVIRNEAITLGVRGTDFLLSSQGTLTETKASVHTFEGSLEVAKTEEALVANQGTAVPAGQSVAASPGNISAPTPFDSKSFLESMKASTPELAFSAAEPPKQDEATVSPKEESTVAKDESPSEPDTSGTRLLNFELSITNATLDNFNNTPIPQDGHEPKFETISVHWAPYIRLPIPIVNLRPSLGVGKVTSAFDKDFNDVTAGIVVEARVHLSVKLVWGLFFEAGVGARRWTRYNGLMALREAKAGLQFGSPIFGFLDRVFLGFGGNDVPPGFYPPANVGESNKTSHEIKLGFGLVF
jgi:hypothetical protein